MHMRDRRQWDWYQPVAKADANGDHGGHHLHGPRDRAVIGLESQNGKCLREVSRFRSRCDLGHIQPKVSKGLVNLPFYRVVPCTCVTGASGTGTSLLPRPMQMVTMGATICMDPGIGL